MTFKTSGKPWQRGNTIDEGSYLEVVDHYVAVIENKYGASGNESSAKERLSNTKILDN